MKTYLYKMECLTNMHVGSGDESYNLVDREVQKDVVLQDVPCIHASGIKGALREYFVENGADEEFILKTFGGEKVTSTKSDTGKKQIIVRETQPGSWRFFGAKLIARPLRVSSGSRPYLLSTSNDILSDFSHALQAIGLENLYEYKKFNVPENTFVSTTDVSELEGFPVRKIDDNPLSMLIGEDYAVSQTMRDFDLPIIARNTLDDDGKSQNLWYEEVVPHKSIFYFAIMTPDDYIADLDGKIVQFGGSASIGQGFTLLTQVSPEKGGDK